MEFLSFDPSSKRLELKRREVPEPLANEVRIKVAYAGICGTDLHILEGCFPCKKDGPFTLGHEFVGTVEAIGSDVRCFKVGQRVAVDPNSGCDKCDYCHNGKYHFCTSGGINSTIGIFKNGGWATHALVPDTQVYAIPEDLDMRQAALAEPLSCLAHGWDLINPVNVGAKILIIGAGIIGLLWACLFHLQGHRKTVTVSEPQEKRRKGVLALGLDYEALAPGQLKEGFDLAIDCSGSGPAMESALSLLRRGARFCVFGVANPNAKMTLEPFQIYMKELNIVGVNINPFTFPKGLALLRSLSEKYLDYDKLGIKVYPLRKYREALEALKRGDISKAIFEL
ncbi:hypothetical protein KM043_001444 [Ampulex compressa]|nr:hypothetical protein KM043_001444 [Ampulex compressa]